MRTLVALVAVAVGGCAEGGRGFPLPRFPQLEQVQESVQGGIGKRYEDYAACTRDEPVVDALVRCMEAAGYAFVPRSADVQATECWRLRNGTPDGRLPDSWCFRHAAPQ